MKTTSIKYIKEVIEESNFIELYEKVEQNLDTYNQDCYNFTNEITGLFDAIGDEIKQNIGFDENDYENEDFDYNVGNGQISCYLSIRLGENDFEIRLSDHADKHYSGNRKLHDIKEKNVKENIYNTIIKEVEILSNN